MGEPDIRDHVGHRISILVDEDTQMATATCDECGSTLGSNQIQRAPGVPPHPGGVLTGVVRDTEQGLRLEFEGSL